MSRNHSGRMAIGLRFPNMYKLIAKDAQGESCETIPLVHTGYRIYHQAPKALRGLYTEAMSTQSSITHDHFIGVLCWGQIGNHHKIFMVVNRGVLKVPSLEEM